MMRKMSAFLILFGCLLFSGCGSNAHKDYPQSNGLPRPERIEVTNHTSTLIYEEGTPEYEKLYETLMRNWWMTAEGEPDMAMDSQLVAASSLSELKTTSWKVYAESCDAFVYFYYDAEPFSWTTFDNKELDAKLAVFMLPEYVDDCENIKGYYTVAEETFGNNQGLYAYYYPAEMLDGFFHWLVHDEEATQPVMTQPISQEMAMLEGYVVMQDGDVHHNVAAWMTFLEQCEAGGTATVTVVQFTQGETGSDYIRYDLSFDGDDYAVSFEKDGKTITETSQVLIIDTGLCDDTLEPYDSYVQYSLNDIILYRDLIAVPDYEGVTEIFLHAKEGEPALETYTDPEAVDGILQLLMTADYIPAEPENYVYGMKLLMTNRDGKRMVIELDLNQGVYRYGMQNYEYGRVSEMLAVLDLEQWPEAVLNEYSAYLNE